MTVKRNEEGKIIGCSQMTYCNECLIYQQGIACPIIEKDELKKEKKK